MSVRLTWRPGWRATSSFVLEGLADPSECDIVALKVNDAAHQPIRYQHQSLAVTTSIGDAFLPAGVRQSAAVLLQDADAALYQTKDRGRDGYTTVESGAVDAHFNELVRRLCIGLALSPPKNSTAVEPECPPRVLWRRVSTHTLAVWLQAPVAQLRTSAGPPSMRH